MSDSNLKQWQPADAYGKRVLVVFAHPDDVDFHFGGTVALLSAAGADITYLCATRGDKGDRSGERTGDEIASVRESEQHAAARTLGVDHLDFLEEKDGSVWHSPELVFAIARKIREVRPDIVITMDVDIFDPSWSINHHDHRAIAASTIDAVYPIARNRNFLKDTPAHVVKTLLVLSYANPDVYVDTSGAFEQQLLALRCHRSQWGDAEPVLAKRRALGQKEAYRLVEFSPPIFVPKT
jgi:LmbE family N-acetylglucosaminyl deacetylase